MGRILLGRSTFFAALVGLIAVQAVAGCGSTATPGGAEGGNGAASGSSDEGGSPSDAGTGDTGNPGETGGTSAGGNAPSGGFGASGDGGRTNPTGGKGNVGGTAGAGNAAGVGNAGGFAVGGSGGFAGVTGGVGSGGVGGGGGSAPECINGVPCNCKKLVGTIECAGSEGTCVCPPVAECATPVEAPCFEPCGGEPFGAWVLEESCFAKTSATGIHPDCQKVAQGTPGDSDLRLRILDGGDMQIFGTEDWTLSTQVSLACLNIASVNSCSLATFWSEGLLFSTTNSANCEPNACGVCDCENEIRHDVSPFNTSRWSRSGTELSLGFATVPYCVADDELWIGGADSEGNAKVSYKFKKQSCTGTPVPCAQRTAEQCGAGGGCSTGVCKPTTGTAPRCATAHDATGCGVLQGCTWDPEGCAGAPPESCEFETCGAEPGCTWGPPRQRCGGQILSCEDSDVSACTAPGCSVLVCRPDSSDFGECQQLQNATACGKAPGCSWTAGACAGDALCAAQTDATTCTALNCFAEPSCGGSPLECSSLSVAACHSAPGCILEW